MFHILTPIESGLTFFPFFNTIFMLAGAEYRLAGSSPVFKYPPAIFFALKNCYDIFGAGLAGSLDWSDNPSLPGSTPGRSTPNEQYRA